MSEDRDAFFDNARFLLMAAVVFGHAIEPLTGQSRALAATYTWLYAFHMPLFVFIAGHFAHASLRIRPLFTRLLLPYVLLQFAYTWFGHVVHKTPEWSLHLLTPDWILWFLLSLLWWRLFLPLWLRLPQPFALACLLALLAGYVGAIGYPLSVSRTLVFFPFFVLGHLTTAPQLARLAAPKLRWLAALLLLAAWLLARKVAPLFDVRWLYGSFSYAALGQGALLAAQWRLLQFGVALLLSAAVLASVPRQRFRWTELGSRSLYAFVLHGFVIQGGRAAGWFTPELTSALGKLLLLLASLLLTVVLCSRPVRKLFRPLLEPSL